MWAFKDTLYSSIPGRKQGRQVYYPSGGPWSHPAAGPTCAATADGAGGRKFTAVCYTGKLPAGVRARPHWAGTEAGPTGCRTGNFLHCLRLEW